jgi:hypothetical protein
MENVDGPDQADVGRMARWIDEQDKAEKHRKAENKRLYERTRDELNANSLSMAESYDREVLALSSAFLGGSLGFIEKIVEFEYADYRCLLYTAWFLLVVTIVLTVASLLHGLWSIRILRQAAEHYYLHDIEDALAISTKKEREAFSFLFGYGTTFALGVICLALFISLNLGKEADVARNTEDPKLQLHKRGIPSAPFQPSQAPATRQNNSNHGGTSGTAGTSGAQQQGTSPSQKKE